MGGDPRTSVVDWHCRLHSCQNVFVVDKSVMPTSLEVQPDAQRRRQRPVGRHVGGRQRPPRRQSGVLPSRRSAWPNAAFAAGRPRAKRPAAPAATRVATGDLQDLPHCAHLTSRRRAIETVSNTSWIVLGLAAGWATYVSLAPQGNTHTEPSSRLSKQACRVDADFSIPP